MGEAYTFERINEERIKDLVYLMKSVHPKTNSLTFYKNKFDTAYTGASYLGYIAYSTSGEPAAFYGVYPVLLKKNDVMILAAQSGDTITHPKHQRQGLFTRLAKATYELAKSEGVKIIFGFPNSNSAHGFFNKLDWKQTSTFRQTSMSFKTSNLYNLLNKFPVLRPLYKVYFRAMNGIYGAKQLLSQEQENQLEIARNQSYFRYKLANKTSFILTVGEHTFWVTFGDGLIVGEIGHFQITPETSASFQKALKKLARITGVKKITFFFQSGSFIATLLADATSDEATIFSGYLPLNYDEEVRLLNSYSDLDTF